MSDKYYDIIIIGSGMAGLYSAYNILKMSPNTSFLILEKHKKQWIGGRTSNETFYGTQIVTGAGIGRKDKNPLLIKLMDELNIKYSEFDSIINFERKIYLQSEMHCLDTTKQILSLFIICFETASLNLSTILLSL